MFSCFFILSYKVKFKKKRLKDAEVESDNNSTFGELSILDKDLNEIIYLLRYSKSQIVAFEDLDRYEDITIFEKLKEINFIVNKKTKHPVRFIYMINDSLFDSTEDKTKFFDAIIPIVPIVDVNNSETKISELLSADEKNNIRKILYENYLYM